MYTRTPLLLIVKNDVQIITYKRALELCVCLKQRQNVYMEKKDTRIKLMNELLNGMKVLKLYAWEEAFEQEILKIRDNEVLTTKQSFNYYIPSTVPQYIYYSLYRE